MKTKIRIQTSDSGNYEHYYIQILTRAYPSSKHSRSLHVAGTIHWQATKGENRPDYWYGLSYKIETDYGRPEDIAYMAKLAKHIHENTYHNVQPAELIQVIGGEEYINRGEFIPASYVGRTVFQVKQANGEVWTLLYAVNEILAKKDFEARIKTGEFQTGYTLVPTNEIVESNLVNT